MPNSDDRPIAQAAYDSFADRYADLAAIKAHNAHYERPATLALLPDVTGKTVLDAGCGPGHYAEWLLDHGAQGIFAFDVSAEMVRITRQRMGTHQGVTVQQADLAQPLDFLPDAAVDVVLAPLALDYVRDWVPPFQEFYRVLRPGGVFVFSVDHPAWALSQGTAQDYFAVEYLVETWGGFGDPVEVPRYRRSFSAVFAALLGAGFVLDEFVEPRPVPAFKETEPEDYEYLLRHPGFLCIRARKPIDG